MANIDPFLTDLGAVEFTTKWVVKKGAAPAGHHTTNQLITLLNTLYVTEAGGNVIWAQASHSHTIGDTTGLQDALDAKAAAAHSHAIGDVAGLTAALAAKADLASPNFSGTPLAPTAANGTNTTQLATTAFVQAQIGLLIGAAPGLLDTLDEISNALGDDPNFAATMTTALSGKLNSSAVTGFALTLLDDADAATMRTTLGLGTAATFASGAFATTVHTHAVSDVTGLTAALAAKADTSHTHAGLAPAGGTTGQVLKKIDGTDYNYSWQPDSTGGGGGGSGDVVGPVSATDDAIVRYDATTGKLIQNSLAAITDAGELDLPYVATPTVPAADHGRFFMGKSGSRLMPRFMGPNGQDTTLQPHTGKNKLVKWNAAGNGTTITADGAPALTATGTATARNVATTNRATRIRMLEYLVTVAATTAVAGFRVGAAQWTIGNTVEADMGGFHYVCSWGTATGGATATHRAFVGMANTTAAPTDVEPSAVTNIVGMGWNAADANVQIMHRGAGAITKIDLGASFPVPNADRANAYMLELYSPPGTAQKVGYKVTNLINNAIAQGEIITNMPTAATFLGPRGWMSVGGTSSVIGIALSQLYVETDY